MNISINDQKWTVKLFDDETPEMGSYFDECYLGLTDSIESTINLRRGMSERLLRSTVIHELVHAFKFAYGYQLTTEEEVCDFFGAQGDRLIGLTNKICRWVGLHNPTK